MAGVIAAALLPAATAERGACSPRRGLAGASRGRGCTSIIGRDSARIAFSGGTGRVLASGPLPTALLNRNSNGRIYRWPKPIPVPGTTTKCVQ